MPEYELVIDDGAPATVRVPDIVLVPADLPDSAPRLLAADALAVVEILSAGSRRLDRVLTFTEFAEAGVPVYLIVEPGPPVTAREFELVAGGYREVAEHRGSAAPALGVTLDLAALG